MTRKSNLANDRDTTMDAAKFYFKKFCTSGLNASEGKQMCMTFYRLGALDHEEEVQYYHDLFMEDDEE